MEILEVTVENFDEKVLNSEKPVMLDFWATWCGAVPDAGTDLSCFCRETCRYRCIW